MSLKIHLHKQCQAILDTRLEVIQNTISNIQIALETETKSTAGDKHETGRAMLHIEREKSGRQLAEIQKQNALLNRINPHLESSRVALGSLIFTTGSNYFLSISLGELKVGDDSFFAISMATPIAKLLVSKSVGDTLQFNGQQMTITKIL